MTNIIISNPKAGLKPETDPLPKVG